MPTKSLPPHSKPWLVALFRKNIKKLTCTGSLIGKTSVLTAAHCTDEDTADKMRVS